LIEMFAKVTQVSTEPIERGNNAGGGIVAHHIGSSAPLPWHMERRDASLPPDAGGPQGLKRESEKLLPPQLCAASQRPNDAIRRKAEKAGRRQRPASQETGRCRDCARASGRGVPMQRGETRRRAVDPWIDGGSACAHSLRCWH
jgi:hypothetical protein